MIHHKTISTAALVGLLACAPHNDEGAPGNPVPPPDAAGSSSVAALPDAVSASCPTNGPSCPGSYEVEHVEIAYSLGDENAPEHCADLDYAVNLSFLESNPVAGELRLDAFFPREQGDWPAGRVPLLLFSAGANLHYDGYADLLAHLASHGIAAMSVDIFSLGASARTRSQMIRCALRHANADPLLAPHFDFQTLAIGGHSRGGEAAVMTVSRLASSSHAAEQGWDVDAVVALAPSRQCEGGVVGGCGLATPDGTPLSEEEIKEVVASTHLSDEAVEAFLVTLGSHDGDVDGQAFALSDLASAEYPNNQPFANMWPDSMFDPDVSVMRKALVYAFDVPHGGWGGQPQGSQPHLRGSLLARAYVGSFLRWNLLGEQKRLTDFDDNVNPPFCVRNPAACGIDIDPVDVFTEYVEGNHDGADRLVVHDFSVDWNPRIPGVTTPAQGGNLAALWGVGERLTGALGLSWGARPQTVEIRLDDPRDVLRYDVLSLRVGVVPPAPQDCVSPAPDFDLNIALGTNAELSPVVWGSDYARLRHPNCEGDDTPQPHAQTIRVPLVDFEDVDLEQVRRVRLEVDPAFSGPPVQLMIDGIEFVNNARYCGNGEIEDQESCDGDDLGGRSCADFGFFGGILGCDDTCRFSTTLCNNCGDGVVDADEVCEDGQFPSGLDCADFGFEMGDLSCDASCTEIGTSTCHGGVAKDPPGTYADCLSPEQQQVCADKGPAGCAEEFGHLDCLGGPCRPTDPSDRSAGALLDWFNEDGGEFHPDGTYRDEDGNLYFCHDVDGERRVCADDDGWGVCRRCGSGGDNDETLLGCPCTDNEGCLSFGDDPPMSCFGADFGPTVGTCWDNDGPPAWQCAESQCGHAPYWGDDELFCEHYAAEAECEPVFACSGPESIICADDSEGLLCDPNGSGCVAECLEDAHCHESFGWPADTCCVDLQCQHVGGGCP